MSYSITNTNTQTFTATHAKHLGAKVATDLKRMQRFYGLPTETQIANFETEIVELLKKGYLDEVTYGFWRNGAWIEPTLRYKAKELAGTVGNDDDPGRVVPGANISGASFYSYLTRSQAWWNITQEERDSFSKGLRIQRGVAAEPGISGYLASDKTYTSGSVSLNRSTVKSY